MSIATSVRASQIHNGGTYGHVKEAEDWTRRERRQRRRQDIREGGDIIRARNFRRRPFVNREGRSSRCITMRVLKMANGAPSTLSTKFRGKITL